MKRKFDEYLIFKFKLTKSSEKCAASEGLEATKLPSSIENSRSDQLYGNRTSSSLLRGLIHLNNTTIVRCKTISWIFYLNARKKRMTALVLYYRLPLRLHVARGEKAEAVMARRIDIRSYFTSELIINVRKLKIRIFTYNFINFNIKVMRNSFYRPLVFHRYFL